MSSDYSSLLAPDTRSQRVGQLAAGGDFELAVGAREVRLDGLGADEQLLRYLTVGEPQACELRDTPLRPGELVGTSGV